MPHNHNTIATHIRTERQRHRWTQTELAHKAGTSRATIARIEAGDTSHTSLKTIENTLKAIGWQLDITPTPTTPPTQL